MKALTLWQPWATLVAIGAKQYETRSWSTDYRGLLAIHAGANKSYARMSRQEPFREALEEYEYGITKPLPLGKVICLVELFDVFPVEEVWGDLDDWERAFGNYAAGRFAWELRNVEVLEPPIAARGYQMLWDWERPKQGAPPRIG